MKKLLPLILIPFVLSNAGCSIFSAYSLGSRSADDIKGDVRKSIVDECVQRSKEYTDSVCKK